MVSFQCHTCGDVVKKPKLDQHRSRCHGGFDCIDCSTTFNSPAEYKGHTSCISEAEKYQKGLYKGPKTNEYAPKNNYPPQPASEPYPGGWSNRGRGGFGGGRGARGGFGGRGGWGQPSTRCTGANDTPLGTPNRGSPVTQPTPVPVKEVPQPPVVESSSNDSFKSKKRKSMGTEDTLPSNGDVPSNKKAKIAQQADIQHVEPASVPLTTTQCEVESTKEKKSKKEKKSTSMTEEAGEKEGKKRKNKEADKKEKSKDKGSDKEEKKKKGKEDPGAAGADGDDTQEYSVELESKKAKSRDKEGKKNKKEKGKEDKEGVISMDDQEGTKESPSKKEKKRKERDEVAAEVPKPVNGVHEKDKKRKRDVEEDVVKHDGDIDAGVDAKEMKKKKKKEKKASENADSISIAGEEAKKKKEGKKLKVAEPGT